ncbi:hypothetical protein [Streptomyces atacamensis]|uniref:hypothetical protein n=1 Tax=Streptomyces atacamensis TaxID=531966 RepID=UPI00399CF118
MAAEDGSVHCGAGPENGAGTATNLQARYAGADLAAPALDERDHIRAAMDRILHGRPERSDGR